MSLFSFQRHGSIFVYLLCDFVFAAENKNPSNHAVILSSSRYWFNYRHAINALSIYQLIKSHGITDDNIVLMLADEMPSNSRNPLKNAMYAGGSRQRSLYDENIEIDYRGDEVTVNNLFKVLLGKGSRTLKTDQDSNILIYWTGHGGDQFFKFQDVEEITATDINRLFQEMYRANKYHEILFIADTCQAFTLGDEITAPNVFMIGSSLRKENSYAHHSDPELGLSVIERYTHKVMEFVRTKGLDGKTLYNCLIEHLSYQEQRAHVGFRDGTCRRQLTEAPMKDFFTNSRAEEAAVVGSNNVSILNVTALQGPSSPEGMFQHQSQPQFSVHSKSIISPRAYSKPPSAILEASDPTFVALVAGLLCIVYLTSLARRS